MFASAARWMGSRLALGLAGMGGAIFGLGLARCLFELDPLRLSAFGVWPGALSTASVGLAGSAMLSVYARRRIAANHRASPWAPLALALPLIGLLAADINPLRSVTLLVGAGVLAGLLLVTPAFWVSNLTQSGDVRSSWSRQFLLSLSLFLCLFCLYLRTLAPAVGAADTFEFQVGVARLGIAHGSGYPLLMLLGRLFTLLPVGGTLAFRANLTSAFFGALASVGVERVSRRLGARPLVALLAGLAFGVSPTLWSRSVEIEAYTLNAAFAAAILYLALGFCDVVHGSSRPKTQVLRITNYRLRLYILAFVFGLSLTNHLTTLLLAPACLFAILLGTITGRRETGAPPPDSSASVPRHPPHSALRGSFFVVLAFLLGLAIYIYLPLRWPAVNHGEALSLAGLLNILTGNEAKGAFQWRLPFQDFGRYPIVWSKIVGEYGWVGLGLALLGTIRLLWPVRPAALAQEPAPIANPRPAAWAGFQSVIAHCSALITLALAYLGYLYFALAFNVPDPDFSAFFIPLHLIAAVLMGLGVQWLLDGLTHIHSGDSGWHRPLARLASATPARFALNGTMPTHALSVMLLASFSLLPMASLWRTFPRVDHSGNWASQKAGELMLNQPLADHAAILADSEKIAPLGYLQIAEGWRPDLDIIVLPDEASYRAALDKRLAAGQVVYLGRYLPGLGSAYSLRSVGPLAEVSPAPFTSTSLRVQPAVAQPHGVGIHLDGYAQADGSSMLSAAAAGELDISLVWRAPAAPTDNLLVNLRLVDNTGQAAWRSAGSVPVGGLYPTNAWRVGEIITDFYSLPIAPSLAPGIYQLEVALLPPFAPAPASAWTAIAPVKITPSARPPVPPHLLRDQFGPNWLLGYDIPEAVAPGSSFVVTLFWRRTTQSIVVPGPSGSLSQSSPVSIAAWPVGAVVPVNYHLTAPTTGDSLDLSVDGNGPAVCGWLAPSVQTCPLPPIMLSGQAAVEGAVNYANQLLLNRARLETPTATPGGSVKVQLEWQALRAIGADYTVFVHLLGPDGLVHGQIDSWPVSGTRATSGWAPGERIVDPYTVQLPPEAPLGTYQVEIGLYLLATGERLPVLNPDGLPIDDRLLLRGLVIQSSR